MAKKMSMEELKKLGCLNPEEYVNTHNANIKVKCKGCNNIITTSVASIRRYGYSFCRNCKTKNIRQEAFIQVKNKLIEAGCLNPEDYINSRTVNLKFKCVSCDNIVTMSWGNKQRRGGHCKDCGVNTAATTRKKKDLPENVLNPGDYKGYSINNLMFICSVEGCTNTYISSYDAYEHTHSRLCKECLSKVHPSIIKAKEELKKVGCFNSEDYINGDTYNLKFKCVNCENTYITSKYSYFNTHSKLCSKCSGQFSKTEEELAEYIKSIYSGKIIRNYKDKAQGITELDIYLPELNYAIEFNGLIWHSEKYQKVINYHKNKTADCNKLGITLWHIWEDDWEYKKDLLKAMIRNKICKDNKRVYARKCELREVTDNKLIKDFMNENHLQGFVGSKVKYGLYFNDELLSLMTFAVNKGTWTLNRFCTKVGYNVVGGASKLLKHFQMTYKVDIYSFSDNVYSNGGLYETLGFIKDGEIRVDYKYLYKGRLEHKFGFRHKMLKSKLKTYDSTLSEHENCLRNGVYRVYDSGKIKWVLPYKDEN